jgi:O-methyltransferase
MTEPAIAGLTPQRALLNELRGMWKAYAIQAAAHYNFATLIGEEHKTTAELAQATGAQEQWVHRVLRLLASLGIFHEVAPRTYANTKLSACLRDNVPGSLRAMARMMGTTRYRQEWGLLEETMRVGTSAIQLLVGEELYTYLDKHPDELEIFDAAIADVSAISDGAFARTYHFSSIKTVLDLGGGKGTLLTTINTHHPHIQGTLFERPHVIEHLGAKTRLTLADHQIELVAGDFFESVPSGADAYILKEVLHNWTDEQCIAVLKQCCQVLQPGAVVLVCEQVITPANNEGDFTKALDLLMGLEQQGGERTQDEYQALFEAAGLRLVQALPTPSPHWVFEAVRAS